MLYQFIAQLVMLHPIADNNNEPNNNQNIALVVTPFGNSKHKHGTLQATPCLSCGGSLAWFP